MQYYFAPLEGLTDYIYRRLHQKYFPGVDKYFTPFLSPTVHRKLTLRESRELTPGDVFTVPQLLTKVPDDFLWMAQQCADLGYQEVNLNLGCPSGTVTAKGKGAGMLADTDALRRFLDAVFTDSPIPISIKTRLGMESSEEFPLLLDIFNQYPIRELIIHPRVRKAFYSGAVNMDSFHYAQNHSHCPVCYNGNLCSKGQIESFSRQHPQIGSVMIGRGLIGEPGMLSPGGTDIAVLEAFMQELFDTYVTAFGSTKNAMFRLKENWRYILRGFENSEKPGKQLRKTTSVAEYKAITAQILHTLKKRPDLDPDW